MCGRFASFTPTSDVVREFDVVTLTQAAMDIEPSWNIPPTSSVRVLLDRPAQAFESLQPLPISDGRSSSQRPDEVIRALHSARWGLVPPWAKSPAIGSRMINARAETADSKRSFQQPLSTSRCIILADGYYEWHTAADGTKTPFYIHASDGGMLALAGLFSWWRDHSAPAPGNWVLTTTILTTAARDGLEEIHDREPVMLSANLLTPWLDPQATSPAHAVAIIAEPGPALAWHEVSRAVGSVRHDSPILIEPGNSARQGTLL